MRFNDGLADREPQSHAVGLGGKECIEDAVDVLRVYSSSCIFDGYSNCVRVDYHRRYLQYSWPIGDVRNRTRGKCMRTSGSGHQSRHLITAAGRTRTLPAPDLAAPALR